jgi:hypothetical protein
MQFLSLYTPATPPSGPPSAEHIAAMMKLMEEMSRTGALVTTGGIMSRNTAAKVVRKNGKYAVENGAVPNSTLMPAAGYALLRGNTREEVLANVQKFMEVAGDGTCELIQVFDEPPKPA